MADGWTYVPLGGLARLDIDRVPVKSGSMYPLAGVLNAGRGLFARDPIDGASTNYTTLHRLHAGQLVMRKLTAWEGPITCVPDEFEGYFVSAEFPTFTLGESLLPDYMRLVCQRPDFWEAMKDRSTGSVQRRKRVSPHELLRIPVRLPPLAEQRRIVDLVRAVDDAERAARAATHAYLRLRRAVLAERLASRRVAGAWTDATLGELASIRIGRTPPRNEPRYWTKDLTRRFCTIADLVGRVITPSREGVTEAAEVEGKAKRVPAGALLMSFKLTIGRVSIAGVDVFPNEAIAWLEPKEDQSLDKRFLALWLEASDVTVGAGRAVKGNTLNSDSLRAIPVAFPSLTEQRRVVHLFDGLDGALEATSTLAEALGELRSALLPDLLTARHEIPASYDRLLDDAA